MDGGSSAIESDALQLAAFHWRQPGWWRNAVARSKAAGRGIRREVALETTSPWRYLTW